MDLERMLRDSLQARAHDVAPSPHTWERVQAGLRRRQLFWWGLATVTAAAAVATVMAVVPAMQRDDDGRTLEFATAPPATASTEPVPAQTSTAAPERTPVPQSGLVATDGFSVRLLDAAGRPAGTVLEGVDGQEPQIDGLAVRPGSNARRLTVAYRQGLGCDADLVYLLTSGDGPVQQIPFVTEGSCPSAPVWSPDGRHVLYVDGADGEYSLHVLDWRGGAAQEFTLRGEQPARLSPTAWVRDGDQGTLHLTGGDGGTTRHYTIAVERTEDGSMVWDPAVRLDEGDGRRSVVVAGAGTDRGVEYRLFQYPTLDVGVARVVEGEQSQALPLPRDVLGPEDIERGSVWLSAHQGTVAFGDGLGEAWTVGAARGGWGRVTPLGDAGGAFVHADVLSFSPVASTPTEAAAEAPPTEPPLPENAVEGAVDTARTWIEAVAAGDVDTAWSLVGEQSRVAIGGREGFEELRTGLAEGWGSWASAEDVTYASHRMGAGEQERLVVVTLSGTRRPEGMVETTAAALPVAVTGDDMKVLPFAEEAFPVEPVRPLSPDRVGAVVPAGVTVRLAVDDEVVVPDTEPLGGGRARATYAPDPPLGPGEHVLTVLTVDTQRGIQAEAFLFQID